MAAALEHQFIACGRLLARSLKRAQESTYCDDPYIRPVQALLRMSVQLAGAIARLEPPGVAPVIVAGPPRDSENRGSIPQ